MKVLTLVLVIAASAYAHPAAKNVSSSNSTQFNLTATPNLRIVNGQDAAQNQFPYQVSLQHQGIVGQWRPICGGSILGHNYILTAAHCLEVNPVASNYRILAGFTALNAAAGAQIVIVSDIIIHELFPGGPVVHPHDIALLRLSTLLNWSAAVQPIAVPNPGIVPSGTAVLSGWGAIDGNGNMPFTLQFANLPIVQNLECNNRLNRILSGREHGFDFESNICSGSTVGHQSACGGDSGGPLAQDGRVIGVVSWGIFPCGDVSDAPTIYARVSNYVIWIQTNAPDLQQ